MAHHKLEESPHRSLSSVPGLRDEDVEVVWSRGTVVPVPAGWSMIHEHEPPDNTYLILEGRARVTLHKETVAHLGPGDLVGEIAPVTHRLRTATVTADESLLTLAFPASVFAALRADVPAFDRAVRDVVAQRTSELDRE